MFLSFFIRVEGETLDIRLMYSSKYEFKEIATCPCLEKCNSGGL